MAKITEYIKNLIFLIILLQIAPPLLRSLYKNYIKALQKQTKVGYLPITGTLLSSTYYIKQLKKFFENDEIKAVMLSFETPGGASGTAQTIYNELLNFKKEHPKQVIALIENTCASGGYYVASACDYIVAPGTALVGSIGASIPYLFKVQGLLNDYKIEYHGAQAGIYKSTTDPFGQTVTAKQKEMLQSLCDDTYEQFVSDVAARRNLDINTADQWANGKILTARQAHQLGLIDELGSRSNAENWLKKHAEIEGKISWVKPPQPSTWDLLFGSEQYNTNSRMLTKLFDTAWSWLHTRAHQSC